MKIKITFICFFLILFAGIAWSQTHIHCGTTPATFKKLEQRLIENKEYLKQHPIASSRNAFTYIPMKFHLVAESDGTGRVDYTRVLDQLCLMNEVFQEFDMSFYIKDGFNEVDDSDIYVHRNSAFVRNRMRSHKDNDALNVWVLGELSAGNANLVGVFDEFNDWIRITNDRAYFGINGFTLPHEVGHFFSLMHPFFGWEIEPYQQEMEGTPAPRMAPNFDVLNEYADGTNCDVAGDRVCDTPADYLYQTYVDARGDTLSNMDNRECKYTRPMTDPKGERLTPDASLIMGYFLDQCMGHFTPQQIELMQSDLRRSNRAYLRSNYTPSEGPITESANLTAPINSAVSEAYNWVPLSWESVNNATGYVVEISRIPGFSDNPLNYITFTNRITIRNLDADRNYFWRVTAFNDNFTCVSPSSRERFRTGLTTSINPIEKVNKWEIAPNPTSANQGITLTIEAASTLDADLKIYATTGQLMYQETGLSFGSGKNTHYLDTSSLPIGIYFVHLENQSGILNKKIIISE